MDLNKQLQQQNIELTVKNDSFTFVLEDKTTKDIKIAELEKYLFVCLLNYIKHYA
jgi:hypothetical protein